MVLFENLLFSWSCCARIKIFLFELFQTQNCTHPQVKTYFLIAEFTLVTKELKNVLKKWKKKTKNQQQYRYFYRCIIVSKVQKSIEIFVLTRNFLEILFLYAFFLTPGNTASNGAYTPERCGRISIALRRKENIPDIIFWMTLLEVILFLIVVF